jgi:cytochrome c553
VTRDDLRPSFATCRECHSSEKKTGQIQSSCGFCHGYHRSLPFDSEKPRLMHAR